MDDKRIKYLRSALALPSLIVNLLVNQTEEEYQRMMIKLRARMVADELKKLPEKPTDNEFKKQSSAKK
jgi:hypothetical protein